VFDLKVPAGHMASYYVESTSLSPHDVNEIAALHCRSLDESFVNRLGPSFVSLLFGHIHGSRFGHLLALRERASDHLLGHISAATNVRKLYLEFLFANSLAALRSFPSDWLSLSNATKLIDTVSYPFRRGVVRLPPAEILTVSIAPEWRGRGLLELLFRALEARFRDAQIATAKIVTAGDDVRLHGFLEHRGWVRVHTLHIHPDDRASCIHVVDWR